MSKHTPGPWMRRPEARLMRDGIQISTEDQTRIAYVQPDDTMEIENGIIVECCSVTQRANASLIAAAPDLLEALRAAQQELADVRLILEAGADFQMGVKGKHRDLIRILREADASASAAIAKAEGKP